MDRKKILWLCSWYPGKTEPFNGDFIQRHAKAAALFNDIYVIHVMGDGSGRITQTEKDIHKEAGLTEHLVYFKKNSSFFGRVKAHYQWLFLFRQAIRKYMVENGKPDLVHVHIPHKAGMLGIWLKKKHKLNYVVTEHWGIYNEVEVLNYSGRSSRFKNFTRKVFQNASACISVSNYLAAGVNQLVLPVPFTIIHNVVDTRLFYYSGKHNSTFRFIHVSNMVPLKNAEGILRAYKLLLSKGVSAELWMVGDTNSAIRDHAASIGLTGTGLSFFGEIPYTAVAEKMQESHCLVVNSNIENSPCVIGEALCCGLPVIATNVGGIPELTNETNSILIPPGNDEALTKAMEQMVAARDTYDSKKIAEDAQGKFSYSVIGKKFDDIYAAAISR
ncbi:MAG: glycosyltransferase [Chitinophagaceae bacterium]|nr:glycosyltransferase [Chitinophagaceae bacterium]